MNIFITTQIRFCIRNFKKEKEIPNNGIESAGKLLVHMINKIEFSI